MTGTPLRETAFAKINLALHVRERMADGYHRLETLFAFAEDGDVLTAELADSLTLRIGGPFAAGLPDDERNLVMQAATALSEAFNVEDGAALQLEKNLPVASGIGGGSADAAAALRLLARLWEIDSEDVRVVSIAETLGADVPACLQSQSCFGRGRGDELKPIDGDALKGAPVLLVNPGIALETAPVFAAWDGEDRGALSLADPLAIDADWRNDLADPAIAIIPEIGEVLAAVKEQGGCSFSAMSGSGATCFALFDDMAARDAAAARLAKSRPDWWIFASRLR